MGCGVSLTDPLDFKYRRKSTIVLPPLETKCHIIAGHTDSVTKLIKLKDGRLASASWDATIKVWNLDLRTCDKTFVKSDEANLDLIQLSDGTLLSGSADSMIYHWDLNNDEPIYIFKGHSDAVYSLIELPDNQFASGSEDTNIIIWSTNMTKPLKTLSGHSSKVNQIILLEDKATLVSCSNDCSIKLWDITHCKLKMSLEADSCCMCVRDLGNGVIGAGYMSREVYLWNLKKKKIETKLTGHTNYICSIFKDNLGRLFTASYDGVIKIWEPNSSKMECIKIMRWHDGNISSFVSIGTLKVATSGFDNLIKIWDLNETLGK